MLRLVLMVGEEAYSFELTPGRNQIGRTEENGIQIDHPEISTVHCEVLVDGESVTVRDRGSTNGTFINGQRIWESALAVGDTLRLGDLELVLKPPAPRVAIPPLDFTLPGPPPPLPDGSAACLYHGDRPADYQCTRCEQTFCAACIHKLRRIGGPPRLFCPACSYPCQPLRPEAQAKKRSFFSFLDFLRLKRKTPPK